MKYGLYLPNFGPYGDARVLAGLARDAEAAGWDGFFIYDHVQWGLTKGWFSDTVDPWVAMSAIALNTSTIRLGALVTPLARRRPAKFVRETVSLDHLSNGRLVVGVGTGGSTAEWDDLGEEPDAKVRAAMLDEALEAVTGLWKGEPFTHDGTYYHFHEALFLPKPVQSPRIPIWAAAIWPHKAPLRRAARWDGVFPLFSGDTATQLAQFREMVSFLRSHRTDDGPFDIVYSGRATAGNPSNDDLDAVAQFAEAGATWWFEGISPTRFGKQLNEEWPLDAMQERILQGPPRS